MRNGKIQHKPKVALRIIKNWEFATYFDFRLRSCVLTRNTMSSVHACLLNTLSVEQLLSTKHTETQAEALLATATHSKTVATTDQQTRSEVNCIPKSSTRGFQTFPGKVQQQHCCFTTAV